MLQLLRGLNHSLPQVAVPGTVGPPPGLRVWNLKTKQRAEKSPDIFRGKTKRDKNNILVALKLHFLICFIRNVFLLGTNIVAWCDSELFQRGYPTKKGTKRSTVAQWSRCFRPTLSDRHGNWGDRGTCQKVSWKTKFRTSCRSGDMWELAVQGFEVYFLNLQIKSWNLYWNCYIYLIVGGLQVHKLSRYLEDQNCEANRWCRMACLIGSRVFLGNGCDGYQYTVYPAQNAWIYIWQNFVTGDIPRFKVLRYSEASLFEL